MPNPWLAIPLADYEGHMASAAVQQTEALSDLFAQALALRQPASVAVLGVAGGNGLERIDNAKTQRVVGVDVNPRYLHAVRQRYSHLRGLELHCLDLSEQDLSDQTLADPALPPVDLVHAAMVFEHAGTGRCLQNALSLVDACGALSVVLQLPGQAGQDVGQGGFASIQALKSHFSLIDPVCFRASLEERGFRLVHEARRSLPAGKAFWMGVFARG
jgi:hypothetical protein